MLDAHLGGTNVDATVCSGEPSLQIKHELESQSESKPAKRYVRPRKYERQRFRQYVDKLKEKMLNEGAQFKLDNVVVPQYLSFRPNTYQRLKHILEAYTEELHLVASNEGLRISPN